jgi:hypothetical protein
VALIFLGNCPVPFPFLPPYLIDLVHHYQQVRVIQICISLNSLASAAPRTYIKIEPYTATEYPVHCKSPARVAWTLKVFTTLCPKVVLKNVFSFWNDSNPLHPELQRWSPPLTWVSPTVGFRSQFSLKLSRTVCSLHHKLGSPHHDAISRCVTKIILRCLRKQTPRLRWGQKILCLVRAPPYNPGVLVFR